MPAWKPNGTLNISTAATDLPDDGMQRCRNLSVDRTGRLDTRPGSTKFGSQLDTAANLLIEQAGARYAFAGTKIYQDEGVIGSGFTDAQWSGIKYNAFNDTTLQVFALNGTDRKRVSSGAVNEWGLEPPTVVPVLAVGASTGLTGDFNAKYSYLRKVGSTLVTESNLSPAAAAATTLSDESLSVTWTASSDTQVTHVRVYRTLPGGSVYFVDQDIAVGTVTVDTTTANASLGVIEATNHDRPPTGTVVAGPYYSGTCFIAKGNKLYYCLAKQPEYWPATSFIEVGPPQFPILAIVEFSGQVYCLSKDQIWFIQGTGGGAFNPVPMKSLEGCPNLFGAVGVDGRGIFHVGADGIYVFAGGRDVKITQDTFEPLFHTDGGVNGMQEVFGLSTTGWLFQYENRLYFHYRNGSALVLNLDNGRSSYYKWDLEMSAPTVDKTNDRMLASDALGNVRVLEVHAASDDAGATIEWDVESKDFTPQTRAHFPVQAKWDLDPQGGTVTGSIVLDDVVHQTHSITTRNTVRRLIADGNGERVSMRLAGSGAATIYAAELE